MGPYYRSIVVTVITIIVSLHPQSKCTFGSICDLKAVKIRVSPWLLHATLLCRGESVTVQSGNVTASAWMDRKMVMVMCTGCDPTTPTTVLRGQKDGTRRPVTCPAASAIYNRYMGGVDLGDQLRGYYHMRMKCRKFYQYVAKFVLDVAITNAFILYKNAHPTTKVNVLTFRHVLSEELIGDYCSKRRPGRSSNLIRTMPLQHHPFRIQNPNGGFKRGRCALHMESRKRKDTQWFCHDCGVWLCHPGTEDDDCYFKWHKRRLLQSTARPRRRRVSRRVRPRAATSTTGTSVVSTTSTATTSMAPTPTVTTSTASAALPQ